MLNILSFQLPVILFLQKFNNPILNGISQFITFLGEAPLPFLITLFILWCYDKKRGTLVASSMLLATSVMQCIKAIFRVPRPFMAFPDEVKGMRVSTSTGFSFPSGHSTTASSFYGAIYKYFKPKWVKVVSILLIILVPISRLYLGAHWPLDVISGVIIGLLAALLFTEFVSYIYQDDKKYSIFCLTFFIIATLLGLISAIILDTLGKENPDLYRRIFHDLSTNTSVAGGIFLGFFLDRKYLNYQVAKTTVKKILVYILGIISIVLIFLILSLIPGDKNISSFISYFSVGVWATFIYPLILTKTKLL